MDEHETFSNSRRQVFLMFWLLAIFALLATALGGLYLVTGKIQPEAVKSVATVGQIFLLYGALNLLVLFGLFWPLRRLATIKK